MRHVLPCAMCYFRDCLYQKTYAERTCSAHANVALSKHDTMTVAAQKECLGTGNRLPESHGGRQDMVRAVL